jgi:hypothetical protein
MLHNEVLLIFIESYSCYLIMLLHFLGEGLVNFLCAYIISILFENISLFRSEVPTFRDTYFLFYEKTRVLMGLPVKYSVR